MTSRARIIQGLLAALALTLGVAAVALAEVPGAPGTTIPIPRIQIGVDGATSPREVAQSLQILLLLTVLSLAPAILIMMTSFTRIIVVLSFVRTSLGTQQMPPNQVLIGLALFLTLFIMAPIWNQVNTNALQPFLDGQIDQEVAMDRAAAPIREFMLRQTREKDLALFVKLGGQELPERPEDLSLSVIVPAFAISELKTAFQIGFVIFVPFIVIDMVVASTLMSMGMMMLPPMMISLPFKILLFVMVDGWHLVIKSLVTSFR